MLTTISPTPADAHSRLRFSSRSLLGMATALALLSAPLTFGAAHAGGVRITNCFGSFFHSFSCITQHGAAIDPNIRSVPGPRDAKEEAEFARRDRQWEARCRPVLRQDQYGVTRYRYAAAGCEFGVLE
jgi:hypothetical protein